jgi:hypothetical protein
MTQVIADQAVVENKIATVSSEIFEKTDYQVMDINFAEKKIGQTKILYELDKNQDLMKL